MGQSRQNLDFGMIRLDIQTWLPSKQQSAFPLPRYESTNLLAYKMIKNSYLLFSLFLRKFDGPKFPKVMHMYDAT